jgi:glycosyltransferase involved in cell wall biosynthesis
VPSLRILYDVDGWAHHHRARALLRHAPPDFDVSIAPCRVDGERLDPGDVLGATPVDLLLVLEAARLGEFQSLLRARGWSTKLVGAWNSGWPRDLGRFPEACRAADLLIINNLGYWEHAGRRERAVLLPNGVDLDVFRVHAPIALRPPRVLWTGSRYHRRLKGYEELVLPVAQDLEARGISLDALLVDSQGLDRRSPAEMAAWYNQGTVFLCASETEGTPNSALEAAACGCALVSTPVGNMPELIRPGVNGHLVERTRASILEGVERALADHVELATAMQADIQEWSWSRRAGDYYAVLRDVLAAAPAPSPPRSASERLDLTAEVTVFVTTVGAPTFDECLVHLRRQDCAFRLVVLDGVAPLSAALQRMVDSCETPFYVQVDEDMLLRPHAIRTLHGGIATSDSRVAMVVGSLYDVHLERGIHGVKIVRHEAVRECRLEGQGDWVAALQADLARSGHVIVRTSLAGATAESPDVLGLHGTRWTPASIYARYAELGRRWRAGAPGLRWFGEYPERFLRRVLDDRSELDLYALMGVMAGVLASPRGAGREKDADVLGDPPGLDELRRFVATVTAPPGPRPGS